MFGGIDPQSGAAVVHEIVRSFGTLKKEGNINKVKRSASLNLSVVFSKVGKITTFSQDCMKGQLRGCVQSIPS